MWAYDLKLKNRLQKPLMMIAFYGLLVLITIIMGIALLRYIKDYYFYNHYLVPWKLALIEYKNTNERWPEFESNESRIYMIGLSASIKNKLNVSFNGDQKWPFIYHMDKFGSASQDIILLAEKDKLTIINLSEQTTHRVDSFIDNDQDLNDGFFRANKINDNSYKAVWFF